MQTDTGSHLPREGGGGVSFGPVYGILEFLDTGTSSVVFSFPSYLFHFFLFLFLKILPFTRSLLPRVTDSIRCIELDYELSIFLRIVSTTLCYTPVVKLPVSYPRLEQ